MFLVVSRRLLVQGLHPLDAPEPGAHELHGSVSIPYLEGTVTKGSLDYTLDGNRLVFTQRVTVEPPDSGPELPDGGDGGPLVDAGDAGDPSDAGDGGDAAEAGAADRGEPASGGSGPATSRLLVIVDLGSTPLDRSGPVLGGRMVHCRADGEFLTDRSGQTCTDGETASQSIVVPVTGTYEHSYAGTRLTVSGPGGAHAEYVSVDHPSVYEDCY